jgi:DNA-binding NtrC family response regulator
MTLPGAPAAPVVFLVDDERRMADAMAAALSRIDCTAVTFGSGSDALGAFLDRGADLVVSDWRMPGLDGIELMRRVLAARPGTPVILVTAYADVPGAVAAMREGAFDYLTKPFDNHELRTIVARALLGRLQRENRHLRAQLGSQFLGDVVAASAAMRAVVALVDRAAGSKATILIQGESGTGKELLARRVHVSGDRVAGPFVAVNCSALAESLLESELFGHEKGAFTGAAASHAGCFERADGGTLFLDEIGDVGPAFQVKLLRVLQEGEVLRVGGSRPRRVDVRIVAATNRDLGADVQAGRFREDLYFRLNVIPVTAPPLRQRPEDILPLAEHFLRADGRDGGRRLTLATDAAARLVAHAWPGNVRELHNVLQRAFVLARGAQIAPEDLLFDVFEPASEHSIELTLQAALDRAAAERIRAALAASDGRRSEAAAALGIDRTTLFRWMRRLGLP